MLRQLARTFVSEGLDPSTTAASPMEGIKYLFAHGRGEIVSALDQANSSMKSTSMAEAAFFRSGGVELCTEQRNIV